MENSLHTTTDTTAAAAAEIRNSLPQFPNKSPPIQLINETPLIENEKKPNNQNVCTITNTKKNNKRKSRKNNWCKETASDDGSNKSGAVHKYSRKEMETLRFKQDLEEQKKLWVEIYCGLSPIVSQEYDALLISNHYQKKLNESIDFDPRSQFTKKFPPIGENRSQSADSRSESSNTLDDEETGHTIVEGEYSQDDDSDEDYSSIQRPAFVVTGEPDFDSGPPQDGLEYLRRVRWEAARVPKVKVAKVNKIKEQSLYIPQIPGIMKCPDNLLPLKQWEDTFLADFAELRLVFSQLDPQNPNAKTPIKVPSIHEEDTLSQMLESTVFEKFNSTISDNDSSDAKVKHTQESSNSNDCPTLVTILKMEVAARSSMLKKRIRSIENMSTLARNDCLWLFALCIAVDCPLDADTSAALRSLLRKCASLRAAKTEVDDQVVVLNILVTISGRYFGQFESAE